MQKIFIPTTKTSREIADVIKLVEELGLPQNATYIGGSFAAFAEKLVPGDVAIVSSLTIFNSVNQILEQTNALAVRGVDLRSIGEPWFGSTKLTSTQFATQLFKIAEQIHHPDATFQKTTTPKKRKSTAPEQHKTSSITKVEYAEKLRAEFRIPVVKACKIAGCSVKTYYEYRKLRS